MRKLFSIIFYIVAGFFFQTVNLLSFISDSGLVRVKWWIVLGFSVPAVIVLFAGLAISRFQNWRKDTAMTLLLSSGFSAFTVFTFMCMQQTEDIRHMMGADVFEQFNDYFSGFILFAGFSLTGYFLLKTDIRSAQQH